MERSGYHHSDLFVFSLLSYYIFSFYLVVFEMKFYSNFFSNNIWFIFGLANMFLEIKIFWSSTNRFGELCFNGFILLGQNNQWLELNHQYYWLFSHNLIIWTVSSRKMFVCVGFQHEQNLAKSEFGQIWLSWA